jgi:hypothetical protein
MKWFKIEAQLTKLTDIIEYITVLMCLREA